MAFSTPLHGPCRSSAHALRLISRKPIVRSGLPSVRTSISAPKSQEPLLSRRNDRELPRISSPWLPWLKTFPIFVAIITVSALGMFNYQKTSSSVVASTLYALRTSDLGREELGDEIYFRDKWPWIWGELNQVQGRINISFAVKGNKASGMMRFRCKRREKMGFIETLEWSLETEDGRVIQLLDEGKDDILRRIG